MMDAASSPKADAALELCDYFVNVKEQYPSEIKHKESVRKYTKIPDFEPDSQEWYIQPPKPKPPRIRRVIAIEDDDVKSTRSLKPNTLAATTMSMTSSYTKRKIVTITEDDENTLHPKFAKDNRRLLSKSTKQTNRAVNTDLKEEKSTFIRSTPRLSNVSKYSADSKLSAKVDNLSNNYKNDFIHKSQQTSRHSMINNMNSTKGRICRSKDTTQSTKTLPSSVSRNKSHCDEKVSPIRRKLLENVRTTPNKKAPDRLSTTKSTPRTNRAIISDIRTSSKPINVIFVPLEDKFVKQKEIIETKFSDVKPIFHENICSKTDSGNVEEEKTIVDLVDANIGTEPLPKVDQDTETNNEDLAFCCKSINNTNHTKQSSKELLFDNLDIPNVTLTKDKSNIPKDLVELCSKSLPNLKLSSIKFTKNDSDQATISPRESHCSYIIGRATVTYTTKQKIDFHVLESSDESASNISSSPLAYPMSVVSVFKKQFQKKNVTSLDKHNKHNENENRKSKSSVSFKLPKTVNILHCVDALNNNKLVKPSNIISTMRIDNNLLQSGYISEQFQRELNFIDSFYESLQYLENCSLTDKSITNYKSDDWPTNSNNALLLQPPEYCNFLSKLENCENIDETETMASKSLSLLNLLIHDEQRRANNLLFVLKMREDALKDFTKSQILWLENKKKQDNTDISTLKKKQRGALLKLQHECGEMQRMRKALLALSEKRKAALMKTKKNIELKLKNNVDVEQLMLGKKKLKRSNSNDRMVAPVKCFDLLSSGCDESMGQSKSHVTVTPEAQFSMEIPISAPKTDVVSSVEKSIQAGDSILQNVMINTGTDTAEEHCVVVDGSYLNILFKNLSLPQIFSCGKQYEVNEEALKNILASVNSQYKVKETNLVEKFMEQMKHHDLDRSSSPSTAHSLVEELDQYYKGLSEEDKLPLESLDCDASVSAASDVKEIVLENVAELDLFESKNVNSIGIMTQHNKYTNNENSFMPSDFTYIEEVVEKDSMVNQTGPLPVPVGAVAVTMAAQTPTWCSVYSEDINQITTENHLPPLTTAPSLPTLTLPVQSEAEELRRQQLAIEQEIKALEQQQCQLLVVREIPDKPPPPYTPPAEARTVRPPRMFHVDDTTQLKIEKHILDPISITLDEKNAFETFVRDFSLEAHERQITEQNDIPWDACNLLPQKPELSCHKLVKKVTSDLKDVLMGVTPTVVTGVAAGSRRTDHIDDILFAEWRRCEPEWTALHTDEASVKNQVFESIFQKVLSETIDEYKNIVLRISEE